MDKKVLGTFVSVGIGWASAQSAIVKDLWNSRKLRSGLLQELGDIDEQLRRAEMIYVRKLQISVLHGIELSVAVPNITK